MPNTTFKAQTIVDLLLARGVRPAQARSYAKHEAKSSRQVFQTSQLMLEQAGVKLKAPDLHALMLASALHKLTASSATKQELSNIYPDLDQLITRTELENILVGGEYDVTPAMFENFNSLLVDFKYESDISPYHPLSSAILAYHLLANDPNFEGQAIDAKLVALAILVYDELDPFLVPKHPLIDAVMDSIALVEAGHPNQAVPPRGEAGFPARHILSKYNQNGFNAFGLLAAGVRTPAEIEALVELIRTTTKKAYRDPYFDTVQIVLLQDAPVEIEVSADWKPGPGEEVIDDVITVIDPNGKKIMVFRARLEQAMKLGQELPQSALDETWSGFSRTEALG